MAKLTLQIDSGNAAFRESDGRATRSAWLAETARILREMADGLEAGCPHGTLVARDANGNAVGHAVLVHFDDEFEDG